MRTIDGFPGRVCRTGMANRSYDADNFNFRVGLAKPPNSPANDIAVWAESSSERLVDDGHWRRIRRVNVSEWSSLHDGRTDDVEVVRRHASQICIEASPIGSSLDVERATEHRTAQRKLSNGRCADDAGDLPN